MADYGSVSKDFIYKAGEGYATNGVDGVKSAAKNTAKKIGKDMVFGAISDALTVAATDSGSASAKAAAGTAANVQTLQTVAEIMESLATHKGSYTDMLGQILSGNEQVNALAENATGVLGSAVNCVNGNGDLVGLSLDLAQTGMDEYKRSEGRNNGEMAGGQIAQSGCNNNQSASSCGGANPVSTSQPVANQQQEAPVISPTPKTEEPQKVYSCDWGAGAKTSDEIEAKNEEIKETKDDTSIKDVKSDESNKSEKRKKLINLMMQKN